MSNVLEALEQVKKEMGAFAQASPKVTRALGQMHHAACKDGGLDFKTMELITIAVAVARKCEPCILSHVEMAIEAGVTREELAAALNAAVLLCGGPGWAYAGKALNIFDELSAAKAQKSAE